MQIDTTTQWHWGRPAGRSSETLSRTVSCYEPNRAVDTKLVQNGSAARPRWLSRQPLQICNSIDIKGNMGKLNRLTGNAVFPCNLSVRFEARAAETCGHDFRWNP